ncbi:MAG: hypothetical protein VX852_00110 [Candidatus Neomarinimicrobiota bacterium]|nr:hypothetical protein [Candidatus Neomarinimicrobiota bacterium]
MNDFRDLPQVVMNTTQKVFLLIFLMSFIMWITFGATYPNLSVLIQLKEAGFSDAAGAAGFARYKVYIATWYQVLLLAVWLGSFVGIFLFRENTSFKLYQH